MQRNETYVLHIKVNKNNRHKKTAIKRFFNIDQVGALREIRTPDPLVRSQVLYPAEL